jgi:hypothetical protein
MGRDNIDPKQTAWYAKERDRQNRIETLVVLQRAKPRVFAALDKMLDAALECPVILRDQAVHLDIDEPTARRLLGVACADDTTMGIIKQAVEAFATSLEGRGFRTTVEIGCKTHAGCACEGDKHERYVRLNASFAEAAPPTDLSSGPDEFDCANGDVP